MPSYEEIQLQMPDGYAAYARYWPHRDPRGAVLYFHGIQSHCGWYEQSAAHLAQAGYVVLQVDRRGCGQNSQDRGHAHSAEQLIADAHAARNELLRLSGLDRYHMVGVSWGGKLVTASYIADPKGVQSLTLVTPGLFPLIGVSKKVQSEIGMAMIYEPESQFDIPLSDPELFTSNPTWQEFFRSDEHTLWQCTAGFYLASRRMDKPIATLPQQQAVPIHLLIAGDEHIIDNEKTINFVRDLSWPDSRITKYDHARHSLEFEACSEKYFDDLVAFINEIK